MQQKLELIYNSQLLSLSMK